MTEGLNTGRRDYIKYLGTAAVGLGVGAVGTYLYTESTKPAPPEIPEVSIYGRYAYWLLGSPVRTLNQHSAATTAGFNVVSMVIMPLVRFGEGMKIVPCMAESWDVMEGGKSIVFHLRDDLEIPVLDRKITADDVAYNFEAARDGTIAPYSSTFFSEIETVDIIDDYTVRMNFSRAFFPIMNNLAHYEARGSCVYPKLSDDELDILGVDKAKFEEAPFVGFVVGPGPFMLAQWVEGEYLRLERNPKFWGRDRRGRQLPFLDGVVMTTNVDPAIRIMRLETEEEDVTGASTAEVSAIRAASNLKLTLSPSTGHTHLIMNRTREPFSNQLMCHAVINAIDLDVINEVVFDGLAQPSRSLIAPWHPMHHEPEGWTYSPDNAISLMEDAGYGDGVSVKLWSFVNEPVGSINKVIQSQLEEVNINVTLELVEVGTWVDQLIGHYADWDLCLQGMTYKIDPYPSWIQRAQLYEVGGGYSDALPVDTRIHELIESYATEFDFEKRKEIAKEVQIRWLELPYTLGIQYSQAVSANVDYVHDLEVDRIATYGVMYEKAWISPWIEKRKEPKPEHRE